MADIFFSYRSVDRERVRPFYDAFRRQGFEVFWDQEVPSGVDWDTWIRQHLAKSKCAIVFWSASSIESDNVRHEATVAKRQGKLIAILLETLTPDQFPMGLYAQQAINLADWNGSFDNLEWIKLSRAIEAKLTPPWMQRKFDELEAELLAERARRESAESRDKILQAQIAKEVSRQVDLKREHDSSLDQIANLTTRVAELSRERKNAEAQTENLRRRLSFAEARRPSAAGKQGASTQAHDRAGALVTLFVSVVVAFAIGFWADALIWPRVPTASTPSRTPGESASSELPKGRLLNFVIPFVITSNTEAFGDPIAPPTHVGSVEECEQSCRKIANCNAFAFAKLANSCHVYSEAEFRPSAVYDAGQRK